MGTTKTKNEFIKDSAKALVYVSGANFDMFAFDDCNKILSPEEITELQDEIQRFCNNALKRLEKKYSVDIPRTSTVDIVESIMYE